MIDQAATPRMMSPPAVAQRLGIDAHKVVSFIRSGELLACNLASAGSRRPRWRIAEDDLQEFLAKRRSSGPAPRPQRRKRNTLPAGFNEYFGRK